MCWLAAYVPQPVPELPPAAPVRYDKLDPKKPRRIKKVYRRHDAMTPLDKLASLPEVHACLREGMTLEHLRALALALTDVQAAEELDEARAALFNRVPARTG